MSKKNLNFDELCRRYAKALLLLDNSKNKINESMDSFSKLIDIKSKNADFEYFLSSPLISPIKKIRILEKISTKLKINTKFANFLKTLADHNRLFAIEKIYNFYKNMIQEETNETNIEVIKNMGFKIGDQLQEEKSYLKYIEYSHNLFRLFGNISHKIGSNFIFISRGSPAKYHIVLLTSSCSGEILCSDDLDKTISSECPHSPWDLTEPKESIL